MIAEPWATARPRRLANWGPDRFARGAMEALDSLKLLGERTRTRTSSAATKVR